MKRQQKSSYGLLAVLLSINLQCAESGKQISPVVRITLTNISSSPTTIGMGAAIFDYSIRFLDTGGHPAALTKEGREILLGEGPGFVVQNGRGIHLKPGQSSSEDLELQRYFDINSPGKYKLLVQRQFTQPSEAVSSNVLEIEVK